MIKKKNKKTSQRKFFLELIEKIKTSFKKLPRQDYLKVLVIIISLLLFTYCYFKFTLIITVDGSYYYHYLKFFKGIESFANWPTIRGYSFPLILLFITSIFGNNIKGILIGFYLFMLILFFLAYKILFSTLSKSEKKYNWFKYYFILTLFFLFNPLIIGYSHTLLTEAVVPTVYLLTIYISYKFYKISWYENKKRFILYSLILALITSFIWFIKQPYAPTVWMIIFLTSVISWISAKKFKEFVPKFITFICCLLFTVISIFSWNKFLELKGKSEGADSNSQMLKTMLTNSSLHFQKLDSSVYCDNDYIKNINITESKKEKLNNLVDSKEDWCNHLVLYEVHDISNNIIDYSYIIYESDTYEVSDAINYFFQNLIKYPFLVFHNYYEGYLTILNFEKVNINNNVYTSPGIISSDVKHENAGIGYLPFRDNISNAWWLWNPDLSGFPDDFKQSAIDMKSFEANTNLTGNTGTIMRIMTQFSDFTFSFFLVFSLPIFIYGFIMCFIKRKNDSYYLITILSGAAFTNIAFHVLMSALIDRYAYPVYPLMLLCIILLFADKRTDLEKEININNNFKFSVKEEKND